MISKFVLSLSLCTIFSTIINGKQVTFLPGLTGKLNFSHYSGYLQASPTHFLHYWFAESQGNPAKDPLLLWMNGGPGCSSLAGMLTEQGPFHVKEDGKTIYLNEYSWNKVANILFLEAPAGVGFSYATNKNYTFTDDITSEQNYEALKQFFKQFPQFRSNDFYVTGESYGGVYVPTLTKRILDGQSTFNINIKGMAIGNGILSYGLNTDSLVRFLNYHGFVGEKTWEGLATTCCHGCADTCAFDSQKKKFCNDTVGEITSLAWGSGLNVYDLYRDCYHSPSSQGRFMADLIGLTQEKHKRKIYSNMAENFSKNRVKKANGAPPCLDETAPRAYLNQRDVRKALFIPDEALTWTMCSNVISYSSQYKDMFPQVRQALRSGLRILIYNGDTDMACNFLMGQKFSEMLNLPLIREKRPWSFNNQVTGTVTEYRSLEFVTVKGAGHMVPQWRPGPALHMISSFLNRTPM